MTSSARNGCVIAVWLLSACTSRVDRTNPFDPEGSGPKVPGRLQGKLYVQGLPTQAGTQLHVFDELGSLADEPVTNDTTGAFVSAELTPGVYSLTADVPLDNSPIEVKGINVMPGQITDVGLLSSTVLPPDGVLTGQVILEDTVEPPSSVRVVATRVAHGIPQSFVQYTDASGAFGFSALPAGDYEVIAEREGFTPDRAMATVAAPGRSLTELGQPLRMYPASAVVRFSVRQGDGSQVIGAPYTSHADVDLLLLAFGGVNEMRFSESPDFVEAGIEVPWRDHLAQVQVTLSAGEGAKTMYAQFRVLEGAIERLRTETYAARVVLDVTPPELVSFVVDPDAVEANEHRYVSADATAVPVQVTAVDGLSTVAGVKLVLGGASAASVPYAQVAASGPSLFYATLVSLLPAGDGDKLVQLRLRDGAGNETALFDATVTVDTTAPALLVGAGQPAIVPVPSIQSFLTSLTPTLLLQVGEDLGAGADGPVRMRVGTSAANLGPWLPFQPQVGATLTLAEGAAVQFFGEFQDAAGNVVSADSAIFTIKLTGRLRGVVQPEGLAAGSWGGTLVEIFAGDQDLTTAPLEVLTTSATGAFTSSSLSAGGYKIRVDRTGYEQELRGSLTVQPAIDTDLGVVKLDLARGGLSGVFQLSDEVGDASEDHSGIQVEAVRGGASVAVTFTDASGAAAFAGLPVGAYTIRASRDGYAATNVAVTVVADVVTPVDADPILLGKLTGDFRVCDQDDAALPSACAAILYTRKASVLLGFSVAPSGGDTLYVRYGADSFLDPDALPDDAGADCGPVPAEQCWNVFDPTDRYFVDVNDAEGRVSLVAQFRLNTDPVQPVQQASVIYDATPPLSPSLAVARGAEATVDGFTRDTEVQLTLSALAVPVGAPDGDVAPLGTVFVARGATYDEAQGSRQYAYGTSAKAFELAPLAGQQTLRAWFCDKAGNCTGTCDLSDPQNPQCSASTVTASIVLDATAPSLATGASAAPTGASVTVRSSGSWWTRSASYDVTVTLGDSGFDTAGGVSVPEVVEYQLSLSAQFVGASWVPIAFTELAAGTSSVTTSGIALPAVEADHVVHVRFKDAAGNVSADQPFTLSLDQSAPSGLVTLAGGAAYANDADAISVTLTASDAAFTQHVWDAPLPAPSAPREPYAASHPTDWALPTAALGSQDGVHTLRVRFFDAAGNASESSASIEVDETPPDGASAIAQCYSCTAGNGTNYFKDSGGEVTLFLFASDAASGVASTRVQVDGGAPVDLTYAPYTRVGVGAEGPHGLSVRFVDRAGNVSASAISVPVVRDETKPTISSFAISGGASTTSAAVQLAITAADGGGTSSIASMTVANSATSFAGASTMAFNTPQAWTLDGASDGTKTVRIKLVDYAGNESDVASDTILLDRTAPTLVFAVRDASSSSSTLTNDGTVAVSLTATDCVTDCAGIGSVYLSNDGDFSSAAPRAYPLSPATWDMCPGGCSDGLRTVYVKVVDGAGNASTAQASIVLDETGPTLSAAELQAPSGSTSYTSGTSVTLSLGVTGADSVRLSGDLISPTPGAWVTAQAALAVSLSSGDGLKTVTVEARDAAENASTPASSTAQIRLDGAAPTGASVSILDGATHTASRTVILALAATDGSGSGVTQMSVANGSSLDCASATYEPLAASKVWSLPVGDGTAYVTACYKDAAGNTASATDSIVLDETAPTSLSITLASGATYVTSGTAVPVVVRASDNLTFDSSLVYQLSTDATFAGLSSWSSFSDGGSGNPELASTTIALEGADGTKTVYLRARDQAGNISQASASVTLDSNGPIAASVVIDGGASYATSNTSRALTLAAEDAVSGVYQMNITSFAGTGSCALGTWKPYGASDTINLAASAGTHTVCAWFKDNAGNVVGPVTDTIVVDLAGPSGLSVAVGSYTGSCATNAHWTNSLQQTVTLAGTDDVGIKEFQLSTDPAFASATWTAWTGSPMTTTFVLGSTNGQQTIYLRVRDHAGRDAPASGTVSVCLTLDTEPPEGLAVTSLDGDYTIDDLTELTLTAYDDGVGGTTGLSFLVTADSSVAANGVDQVAGDSATSYAEGTWIGWPDDDIFRVRWDLALPATKVLEIMARDPAGNVSARVVTIVSYDAGDPSISSFTAAGGSSSTCGTTYVNTPQIEARFAATDAATGPARYKLAVQHPGCTGASTLDEVYDAESWVDEATLAAFVSTIGLPCGDGDYQFKLGVQDAAGNTSSTVTRCLTLDTVAPTLFSVTSTEGPFSNDELTTVTVIAADERTSTSALGVQVADGASALDPVQSDVQPTDGVDQVNGTSSTAFDVNEWFTWPDDDAFRVRWHAGDGAKRLHVRVRDLAGNESAAVALQGGVTVDTSAPTAPVITFVRSLNAAAELAWSASDPGSGTSIASYRVEFVTTDAMTPVDSGFKDVGTETQWILTGAEGYEHRGLQNKRQYEFRVTAYDQAGNSAQSVSAATTAVGWTVTPVVTGSARPLVPQDIAYSNGKIYVLFHELGAYAGGSGMQTAAATKLAVSSDGGATWAFSLVTVESDTLLFQPGRVRSQMSVGTNGVSIVTVSKTTMEPPPALDLVEYSTTDDGLTWTKYVIDANIGLYDDAAISFGMSRSGSSRVVLYSANEDPAPNFFGGSDYLVVRRAVGSDDVRDLEGGVTPKWWAGLHVGATTNVVHTNPGAYYSVCNANFFDHAAWTVPVPAQQSKDDTLQIGEAWTMVSPFHGRGRWTPVDASKPGVRITGENLAYLTLSCAALGDVAWFHYVGLKRDGAISFLARTNNHAYGEADSLAGDTVTTIVSPGGADLGSPVATWAGGNKVYVAYRRGSDASLAVLVGTNTPPSGSGSVTFSWRENIVDPSGDAGRNPVMTGFATESPLIAYTDLQGSELKIARAAQLAPQPTPDARYDLARYTWSDDGVADAYIVSVSDGATCSSTARSGPDCSGGSTCSYTALTQYSYTASAAPPLNRCVETVALDDQGLPGDLGEKWQLAPFTEVDLATESWPTRVASSLMSGIAASGSVVAALRPTYNSVIVELSEDAGATFPAGLRQTLYAGTAASCTPPASPAPPSAGSPPDCIVSKGLAMTTGTVGADTAYYVHVFFQTRGNPGAEVLRYVRGSKIGAGSWSWSAPVTVASDAVSIGQDVSVRAEGSYVVAAYRRGVSTPTIATSVYVRTSADHGVSWINGGVPTGVSVGGPDGFKPAVGDIDVSGGPARIYAYYFTPPVSNPTLPSQKDIVSVRSTNGGGSFNDSGTPNYRLCDGLTTFTGDKQQCGDPQILAAGRNAQYFIVASVDGQAAAGPRVRVSVTSDDIATADGTAGADGWSRFNLDVGSRVVMGRSFAMDANDKGAWLTYSTCDDLGVSTVWKLNLAYCQRDCHSAESWKRVVVRNQTSSELSCSGEWYNGLAIDADSSTNQLLISYVADEQGPGVWAPRTRVLRGGWIQRQR